MNTFKPNQSVTTIYGKPGTVIHQDGIMVLVMVGTSFQTFHHSKVFACK